MNNRECAKTMTGLGVVLIMALVFEPSFAIPESEINYQAVPKVTNKDRAAHRDAYYEGYTSAQEDYFSGKEIGYEEGWCAALSAVNVATGSQLRTEGCEE